MSIALRVDLLYISLTDRQMTNGPFISASTNRSYIESYSHFSHKCVIVSGSPHQPLVHRVIVSGSLLPPSRMTTNR
jgi:hypothetical protein